MDTDSGQPEADRRRFRRVPLEGSVRLYSGSTMWETDLLDLSLKGVLVARPAAWTGASGARFRMDLRVNGTLVISMGVEAARIEADRLAFAWDRIDLDSFARLKRLIELNLGRHEQLHRELAALGS
ncbi:MAG: PilZ domain-containing protein [Mizugakiibacter sp.]|uniref:PilZ domain-containing protein n=1 Tax=Mizugakiibacter sp. TaxID=1972610 RepID=UPI0031C7038E|nr:PilZ domain-containing protein [Xanthomonadaceae bacterium]